ncbi:hypothetical protein [Pseudomonas shirazica]|uniref:hypothetical protein n=1 Tax=Pseudomonas shirazica TaxID=1940636 RepID=UPI001118EC26|nr:hypothetical protein [Pseudomonas shirazica]
MKCTTFEWDKFAQKASFNDVRMLQFHTGRLPSMYNPDRTEIHLSSVDVSLKVDDVEGLKAISGEIAGLIKNDASSLTEHRKLVELRADYNEIGNLMYGLGEDFDALLL